MVLIDNMKMPKNCSLCSLKDMYYGECNVMHKRVTAYVNNSSKPVWCPLREVKQEETKDA